MSSSTPRQLARGLRASIAPSRQYATASASASTSTPSSEPPTASPPLTPPLRAALLLSRPPLLTPTQTPLQKAYHDYTLSLRHSLSNPAPIPFYFRPDSLPLRRFLRSQHSYESSVYPRDLVGPPPKVGDIPEETEIVEHARDKWAKEDERRGEKSLERLPEEELFCLVRRKGGEGAWEMPWTDVRVGEGLDEAVERGLTGVGKGLEGESMDSWLVTRKPIGFSTTGDRRTFFMRSYILAGEPSLTKDSTWSTWAWLNAKEVEERLGANKDGQSWDDVRGMFGIGEDADDKFLRELGQA